MATARAWKVQSLRLSLHWRMRWVVWRPVVMVNEFWLAMLWTR